jgi:hypothetical protein
MNADDPDGKWNYEVFVTANGKEPVRKNWDTRKRGNQRARYNRESVVC